MPSECKAPDSGSRRLLAPAPALAGRTIVEALKSGHTAQAIALAESLGEQAA